MKETLRRAFNLKPFTNAVTKAVAPRTPRTQPDSFATRVAAHTAALVALMDATVAVNQAAGIKTAAALEEHAASLSYLKLLANAGAKAVPSNPYWSERKGPARTQAAAPGQSIHTRIRSRTK